MQNDVGVGFFQSLGSVVLLITLGGGAGEDCDLVGAALFSGGGNSENANQHDKSQKHGDKLFHE